MLLILIALIAVVGFSIYLERNLDWNSPLGFFPFFTGLCGVIGLIFYAILCFKYLGAEHKAAIINREYDTNYTAQEVFYAEDVIDTIREIDRKRIELNGDLMREKE